MKLNHADIVLSFEGDPLKEAVALPGARRCSDACSTPQGGVSHTFDQPGCGWTMRDVTFRSLALSALAGAVHGETMGAEDKARCFHLSAKFFRGKFVKLTHDEHSFLKARAGVILTPIAYGRLSEWLDGDPQVVASDTEADDAEDDG